MTEWFPVSLMKNLPKRIYVKKDRYYFPDDGENGGFVAIDDSTGDEWTEWFPTEEQAISYLMSDDGTGDDFRDKAIIETFDAPRGIGKPQEECLIVLKPSRS